MGGIRFKINPDGPFLSDNKETAAPPWATLRTLEKASRNFESDESGLTEKWLNQLIKPGSSLGGARPKATVVDTKDQLWIAKFPSRNDENDTGAWEMVAHDLAGLCGLNVPEAKLEKFSNLGSTYLIKRFDRVLNKRVHFASAMTLLGKTDGASAADGTSYLDMAAFIKSYGDELSLNVDEEDNSISIELAISTAVRFGISETDAKDYAKNILAIVRENWEKTASCYGLSRRQIEEMRPAFSACYE